MITPDRSPQRDCTGAPIRTSRIGRVVLGLLLGRRWREQHGQALPLAAVGIFAMCLGVLATMNLGHAVHEKIKLQNAADSAAYSLAAMEARTFNYIAFLNRAQIAHYNTAMMVQSYMSWVGYQVALFGTAADLMEALDASIQVGTKFPYPANTPYTAVAGASQALAQVAKRMRDAAKRAYKNGHKIGHKIVEAMAIFNKDAIWQSQAWRAVLMNINIMTGMQSYIEKVDKQVKLGKGKSSILNTVINTAMNSLEYYQAFDKGGGVNPFFPAFLLQQRRIAPGGAYTKASDKASKDAYRVMTELIHATRTPQFVSNRGGFRGSTPPALGGLVHIMGLKMGQTKFTERDRMSGASIVSIRSEGTYALGTHLSSDDYLQSAIGTASLTANVSWIGTPSSLGDAIAAYERRGKHYSYTGPKGGGGQAVGYHPGGMLGAFPPIAPIPGTHRRVENDVKWPGFAPFFKFNAKGKRTSDYNQPSTWFFLNKHHKDFQSAWGSHGSGRAPWRGKFSWTQSGRTVKLDTTVGSKRNSLGIGSLRLEGLNVIARGMAYYHRPGNWKEQPNFFNPFWRARLAPVGQKLQAFWEKFVSSKITSGADSAVIRGVVNVLRNAQMDLFTSAITSVITH